MVTTAQRTETLVRALEASIAGDSSVIAELYADDVQGRAPALSISSAAELAVEFEDRDEAFSEIELDVSPVDVTGERACVEWVVSLTHSGPLAIDDETVIEPTGRRVTLHGVTIAEFIGRQDRVVPPVLGRGRALGAVGTASDGGVARNSGRCRQTRLAELVGSGWGYAPSQSTASGYAVLTVSPSHSVPCAAG